MFKGAVARGEANLPGGKPAWHNLDVVDVSGMVTGRGGGKAQEGTGRVVDSLSNPLPPVVTPDTW